MQKSPYSLNCSGTLGKVFYYASVAQLVRVSDLYSGGRRFESYSKLNNIKIKFLSRGSDLYETPIYLEMSLGSHHREVSYQTHKRAVIKTR